MQCDWGVMNSVWLWPSPSWARRWGHGTRHCSGHGPWDVLPCAPSVYASTRGQDWRLLVGASCLSSASLSPASPPPPSSSSSSHARMGRRAQPSVWRWTASPLTYQKWLEPSCYYQTASPPAGKYVHCDMGAAQCVLGPVHKPSQAK